MIVWLQDEPRVGLAAVVQTSHGTTTVALTHLFSGPVWNGIQLRQLATWLTTMPGPCVLLGDLNMPWLFPRVLSRWRSPGRLKTYPTGEPKIQLDHALAHGGLPGMPVVGALAAGV